MSKASTDLSLMICPICGEALWDIKDDDLVFSYNPKGDRMCLTACPNCAAVITALYTFAPSRIAGEDAGEEGGDAILAEVSATIPFTVDTLAMPARSQIGVWCPHCGSPMEAAMPADPFNATQFELKSIGTCGCSTAIEIETIRPQSAVDRIGRLRARFY